MSSGAEDHSFPRFQPEISVPCRSCYFSVNIFSYQLFSEIQPIMNAKPRHDWYQSDTEVILTILKRGVPLEDCRFTISNENNLKVTQREDVLFEDDLFNGVKTNDVTVKCTPVKVSGRCVFVQW